MQGITHDHKHVKDTHHRHRTFGLKEVKATMKNMNVDSCSTKRATRWVQTGQRCKPKTAGASSVTGATYWGTTATTVLPKQSQETHFESTSVLQQGSLKKTQSGARTTSQHSMLSHSEKKSKTRQTQCHLRQRVNRLCIHVCTG